MKNKESAAPPTGSISSQILSEGRFSGIFAGWGASRVLALQTSTLADHSPVSTVSVIGDTSNPEHFEKCDVKIKEKDPSHGLTTVLSVSIAGSDIMSSCLYTAGICAYNSGKVSHLLSMIVHYGLEVIFNPYFSLVVVGSIGSILCNYYAFLLSSCVQ